MGSTFFGLPYDQRSRTIYSDLVAAGVVGLGSRVVLLFHPESAGSRGSPPSGRPIRFSEIQVFQLGGRLGTSMGPVLAR